MRNNKNTKTSMALERERERERESYRYKIELLENGVEDIVSALNLNWVKINTNNIRTCDLYAF